MPPNPSGRRRRSERRGSQGSATLPESGIAYGWGAPRDPSSTACPRPSVLRSRPSTDRSPIRLCLCRSPTNVRMTNLYGQARCRTRVRRRDQSQARSPPSAWPAVDPTRSGHGVLPGRRAETPIGFHQCPKGEHWGEGQSEALLTGAASGIPGRRCRPHAGGVRSDGPAR